MGKYNAMTKSLQPTHIAFVNRAKLESCLLGRNTKVGAKADLSRCATQSGYEVDAGGKLLFS
jgi:translation initiation factor eIF-2B subunit gamma